MRRHDHTRRTRQRARAIDVLFEADQRGMYSPGKLTELCERRVREHATQAPLPDFSQELVMHVAEHMAHVDYAIASYLDGWSLERLPAVDRAVLRAAVGEILYSPDVDAPIVIDEAVKLVKFLSTPRSPGFVNGILDTIASVAPGLRAQEANFDDVARQAAADAPADDALDDAQRVALEAALADSESDGEYLAAYADYDDFSVEAVPAAEADAPSANEGPQAEEDSPASTHERTITTEPSAEQGCEFAEMEEPSAAEGDSSGKQKNRPAADDDTPPGQMALF